MTEERILYTKGYLDFSCEKIECKIRPHEVREGNFEIHTSGKSVRGMIISTDTRFKVSTDQFLGECCTISYTFDGTHLENGAKVTGKLIFLSTVGEYSLAFEIEVDTSCVEGTIGTVKDLFQFTDLAKLNWKEAVSIFYTPEFESLFSEKNESYLSLYKGLSRTYGNEQNVEEFLVAIRKKLPVKYTTDIDSFRLENVMDTVEKTVLITKTGWGYTQLSIEWEGSFIQGRQTHIQQEDFEDGICALTFKIDAQRLHTGTNQGKIHIYNTCYDVEIPVFVFMKIGQEPEELEERTLKRVSIHMLESYAEMKMRKITKEDLIEREAKQLSALENKYEDNLEFMLYKTQIFLMQERFNDAKWYLDQIGNRLRKEETTTVIKSYYYYLSTLYNQDESYLNSVKDYMKVAYHKNPKEWRIGLLFMNLEEDYVSNPEAKWHFLEEQFKLGCMSPVLFCEAVGLVYEQISLIRELGEFEQHVLWYAAKNDALHAELMELVEYLSSRVKTYSTLMYRICSYIYQKKKSNAALTAICRLLILGDKRGEEYLSWYLLGIREDLRIPKIYEYYMYSIDLSKIEEIPKIVLMYFAYQNELDYERTAYLYAYLLNNREHYMGLVDQYRKAMETFVMDQMRLGRINTDLAYLYQHLLVPQMLRDEMAFAFTPLLFTHEIRIHNPKIQSVVLIHQKMKGESSYPVVNGICFLPIYGDEVEIFLEDEQGNRYVESVEYANEALMDVHELLPMLTTYMEGRLSFDIYLCETEKSHVSITEENEKRYKKLVESEQVLDRFKQTIRSKLLHYYYEHDLIGDLDSYLEEIEPDGMHREERAEFIKFLISRGMFDKAYTWVKKYGMAGVDPKNVARLVSKRILSQKYVEDEFLINVSFYIFRNSKYDENILIYLEKYYIGGIRDLRDVWNAARNIGLSTIHITDRLLEQMKITGAFVTEISDILIDYIGYGEHDEKLAEYYFEEVAKNYFIHNHVTLDDYFDNLYQRYRKAGDISKIQKLALLKYKAEKKEDFAIPRETVMGFVEEFWRKDIYFPFYSVLAQMVPQLHYLKNKAFIEYRTKPGSTVKLHYHFDLNHTEQEQAKIVYRVEEMQEMVEGIYVKAVYLFQGETLQYYITDTASGQEELTLSDILTQEIEEEAAQDRYSMLNEIVVSLSMKDEITADILLEEYLQQDFYARDLFRVM